MHFLIVGAGALGSILAAHLVRRGHPVNLVARGRRAEQVAADGIALTGLAGFTVSVPVVRPGEPMGAPDVVINCVKTYDTGPALAGLNFANRPVALSLQNGIVKNEALAERFGDDHWLGATASVSGELKADGRVLFTANDRLPIGEPRGGRSPRVAAIVAALRESGIAADESDDITATEWTKYAMFVAMMSAALLTRQHSWRPLSDPHGSQAVARLIREVGLLAAARGIRLLDRGALPIATIAAATPDEGARHVRAFGHTLSERAPEHRVSTLQDLLRGGRLEVEEILGHAVALARRHAVAVPTIETCYQFCAVLLAAAVAPEGVTR
ncbi:MAG TPA: ketopantoate reductase family protein [Burkholderiaceae bacterium]|nr:ketopantoate reductase family protein [Burkholderiaceae bacterium]